MKTGLLIIFGGIIFLITSCSYDKEVLDNCTTTPATFSAHVSTIIQVRCATQLCHDANSTNVGGPFTNYTLIKNKATQIKDAIEAGVMPQGSTLSQAEIAIISCWVQSGAPNN
jgi:hypothetical protein